MTKHTAKPPLFDPACLTLAAHFLQDELLTRADAGLTGAAYVDYERRVDALAAAIQDAVEDWFSDPLNHRVTGEETRKV